ncbi:MAG TPA: hypothetical protein VMF59_01655 [Bacteroidota bacterium]|nr:hypothetical protein [Bacteroidota bacterium]
MKTWWIGKVFLFIGIAAAAVVVFGGAVMLLWNATVPDLFHGPAITFVQSIALMLLAHILLRGWSPWRFGHGWRRDRWRRHFEKHLESMTPEEREKHRESWHMRCGGGPEPGVKGEA